MRRPQTTSELPPARARVVQARLAKCITGKSREFFDEGWDLFVHFFCIRCSTFSFTQIFRMRLTFMRYAAHWRREFWETERFINKRSSNRVFVWMWIFGKVWVYNIVSIFSKIHRENAATWCSFYASSDSRVHADWLLHIRPNFLYHLLERTARSARTFVLNSTTLSHAREHLYQSASLSMLISLQPHTHTAHT